MELEIISVDKSGLTGRIAIVCRILDSSNPVHNTGASEKFETEAAVITDNYNGSVEQWIRAEIIPGMLARHKSRTAVHSDLYGLKGKKLPL